MIAILITLLVAYLLFSVWLGFKAKSQAKNNASDYFLHGRNVGWFSLSMTLFATWMSTFAFLGSPGYYFAKGVSWFLPHGLLVVASPMLLYFLGRRIWALGKKYNYMTPGDLIGDRYSSQALKVVVGLISIIALIPYSMIQVVGIGKVIEIGTSGAIPYWGGVVMAISGIGVYSYIGGIRAIIWTDIIQAILFIIVMLIGAVLAVSLTDGFWVGLTESIAKKPELFTFNPGNWGAVLTTALIWTVGYILLPHMWQRSYMADSPKTLGKSAALGSCMALLFIVIPSLLMGFWGTGSLSIAGGPDSFVPSLYNQVAPALIPILVLATFAAGMSTVDSQLLSASSVLLKDVVEPITGKKLSAEREKTIGRLFVLGFVGLLATLALTKFGGNTIVFIASKGTGIATLFLVPLLGALFIKKVSPATGTVTLVGGAVILFILETGIISMKAPYGIGAPVVALIFQAVCFFIVHNLKRFTK